MKYLQRSLNGKLFANRKIAVGEVDTLTFVLNQQPYSDRVDVNDLISD